MGHDGPCLHHVLRDQEALNRWSSQGIDEPEFHHMDLVKFIVVEQRLGYFYDIGYTKHCYFHNKLEIAAPYQFLVANASLTSGAGLTNVEPVASEVVKKRPVGAESAKAIEEGEKSKGEERPVKNRIYDISLSFQQLNAVMISKSKEKEKTAMQQLQLIREMFRVQHVATKSGSEQGALKKETDFARQLMLKQASKALADIFQKRARKTHH